MNIININEKLQNRIVFKCHLKHLTQYVLIFSGSFFKQEGYSCFTRNNLLKEASVREQLTSLILSLSLLISDGVKKWKSGYVSGRERGRDFFSLSLNLGIQFRSYQCVILDTLAHQLPDRRRNVHSHPSLSFILKHTHFFSTSSITHGSQITEPSLGCGLNFLSLTHIHTLSPVVFTVG